MRPSATLSPPELGRRIRQIEDLPDLVITQVGNRYQVSRRHNFKDSGRGFWLPGNQGNLIDPVGFLKHYINSFIVPGRNIFAHDIGSNG